MDTHKNAQLTPKGREMMVRAVVDHGLSKAAAARQFNTTPKTVAKWVERFEAEGAEGLRDRSSRPRSSPSQATPAVCAAVAVLRRRRHTGEQIAAEGRRFGGDRQPHSQAPRPQPAFRAGASRADPPLRTRSPWRNRPHQHQEARQVQQDRSPHHRRSHRPEQHARGRLGVSASGDRRPLAHRLLRVSTRRKASLLPALYLQRPALLSTPWRQGPARHDRQWLKLPIFPLRQGDAQAQNQALAHKALDAQDQRQGRTVRPNLELPRFDGRVGGDHVSFRIRWAKDSPGPSGGVRDCRILR
jgi:transposase